MEAKVAKATTAPLFEVQIPDENTIFAPRTFEEIEAWLDREKRFWTWLDEAKRDDAPIEYVIRDVLLPLRRLTDAVGTARNAPEQNVPGHINQVRSLLEERLTSKRVPTAESPKGQYIARLAARDKVVAAHALWMLLGNDTQGSNRPSRAFRGQVLATLYSLESESLAISHTASWAELQKRVSSEQELLRNSAANLSDEFHKSASEIAELHNTQRSSFDELQAARDREHRDLVDTHKSAMGDIETTFKRELSLRSAVDYLSTKADMHQAAARKASIAAGISGAVLAGLAIYVGVTVFKDATAIQVPRVAVAVLTATLAFWLLRILVRVLLSNLHLETDMRARSTFVHTYLALLAEGGGIKDEDRALVIGLVFRPISDGLVRDDATPPGLWDLVTKNLGGKG